RVRGAATTRPGRGSRVKFAVPRTLPEVPLALPRSRARAVAVPARSVFALAAAALLVLPARSGAHPRPPEPMDGGQIAHELHRLQTVGSALFVAAHPDDENTALLAWLTHVK